MFFAKKEAIFTINFEGNRVVERRFREFHQLWQLLQQIYPSQVIPPLPSENSQEKWLNYAMEAMLSHPIVREDEYFKTFLQVENYEELVPMIRNVEAPVAIKREYFCGRKWWKTGSSGMPRDLQYQRVNTKLFCACFCFLFLDFGGSGKIV